MDNSPENENKSISFVVSGDVTMDFNIALWQGHQKNEVGWKREKHLHVFEQRGSVLMLTDLVRAMIKLEEPILDDREIRKRVVCPQDPLEQLAGKPHSFYSTWKQIEDETDKTNKSKHGAWRVANVLGFQRGEYKFLPILSDNDNKNADILILDDGNLGFRDEKTPKFWTQALLSRETPPWVMVKMCQPICDGNLWNYLHENHANKLIALLTIDDLRTTNVQISRELSWELAAQDLVRELIYNPSVNGLANCAFVVVLFGTDGAVLLSQPGAGATGSGRDAIARGRLFFDPKAIEGEWNRTYRGDMVGYKTCMAASIARSLMKDAVKPDMDEAIKIGLSAMRNLHREGYQKSDSKTSRNELAFPIDRIARFLTVFPKNKSSFVDCEIRQPKSPSDQPPLKKKEPSQETWTILSENYDSSLESLASRIAVKGVEEVLDKAPRLKFGGLLTVDRREIESFRGIRTLIEEYLKAGTNKPLSIAVFGPPGSGKSFGIKQMAKSLLEGRIKDLTFNLSQFSSADELRPALYQVRDVGLTGKLPLIFWDEFDTALGDKAFGWLRYFLAPMQDGNFQDGQITHPIGPAIFVFAGGTSKTIEEFSENLENENLPKEVKLRDFLSRLRGYVNILGPDRVKTRDDPDGVRDDFYVIRRAILLRSLLLDNASHFFGKELDKLRIDEGVLHAFLETREYRHGARSMESVIAMSLTDGAQSFGRSCLPSRAQLNLHVDADDFMLLISEIWFTDEILEKLARKVHETYLVVYGPGDSYDDLNDYVQDQNRDFVRDIVNKLRECNCRVVAGIGKHSGFKFEKEEVEKLAKMEHKRWLIEKVKNNFRYAPKAKVTKARECDSKVKLNDSMLFWDEEQRKAFRVRKYESVGKGTLSEKAKENNRKLIESIPDILASEGYAIVRK